MPMVLDLPYDILQHIFAELSPVDVLNYISTTRKLYLDLIDDTSTWRPFCASYGITNNELFGGRSFRIIYARLLHRYGPLIGLWCSDYPFKGNIIEFRLLPDHWLRSGEMVIVGDVWEFFDAGESQPHYPNYIEFVQIGFTANSIVPEANDVHISWHLRSERDLGFPARNDIPLPWLRIDGGGSGTPSLHVVAPTTSTLKFNNSPEFPEALTAPWLDVARGVPRMPQEPLSIVLTQHQWWTLRYVDGVQKPASISIYPPPLEQPSDIPDLHKPWHPLSSPYRNIEPRYYPLRTIVQEGTQPASPDWRAETLVGLWLGDYGSHGTECLFLEHDAVECLIRAWKVTGDVNVPRGACTWYANLRDEAPWADPAGSTGRAYPGMGCISNYGFT